MRWTRLAAIPFLGLVFFLAYVFLAPVLYAYLWHTGMPDWLSHLRQTLLPGSDLVTMLAGDKNALSPKSGSSNVGTQPYTWIIFGCLFLLFLLVSYDVKLARTNRSTYGSARNAGHRELRAYRSPQSPSWMLRVPLFAFQASSSLVSATIRVLGTAQNNVQVRRQTQRPGTPSRFILGKQKGRIISLTEKQQEEHLLMTAPQVQGRVLLRSFPTSYESRETVLSSSPTSKASYTTSLLEHWHIITKFGG